MLTLGLLQLGCTPPGPPLAAGVAVEEAVLGQNTGILLVEDGSPVAARLQPVVAGREARFRIVLEAEAARSVELVLTVGADEIREVVALEEGNTVHELVVPGEWLVEGVDVAFAVYELDGAPRAEASPGAKVPANGDTLLLGVRDMPGLRVTLVPLVDDGPEPVLTQAYADAMRDLLYAMFPVSEVTVDIRDASVPFEVLGIGADGLADAVDQVSAAHVADGAGPDHLYLGQYYELSRNGGGLASGTDMDPARRAAVGPAIETNPERSADIAVHELGHLLGAFHTPCIAEAPHPAFPDPEGLVGVRVWDGLEGRWRNKRTPDFMGYCPDSWTSPFSGGQLAEGLLWWD
ncbi:MAG: hypothetical protein AAF602_07450 [Myxococcota bacterium]